MTVDLMAALRDSLDEAKARRVAAADLATVTPLRTATRPGYLPHRWTTPGQSFTYPIHRCMAVVEDQAAIAYEAADGDVDAAFALLHSAGCHLTTTQVERLYGLSQAARDAEDGPTRAWHDASDEYAALLHSYALETRKDVTA